ncbi:MAG: thiamine phosphate synthase [Pseudomonadota bacterium]
MAHRCELFPMLGVPSTGAEATDEHTIAAADLAERLRCIVNAACAPCVLLHAAGGIATASPLLKSCIAESQKLDAAAIVVGGEDFDHAASSARAVGADGLHMMAIGEPDAEALAGRIKSAIQNGDDLMFGVNVGLSRHNAMMLAEAGAAYIGFSAQVAATDQDARREMVDLVTWWAEVFEIPCVALNVPHDALDEVARLAEAGADFVSIAVQGEQTVEELEAWAEACAKALTGTD